MGKDGPHLGSEMQPKQLSKGLWALLFWWSSGAAGGSRGVSGADGTHAACWGLLVFSQLRAGLLCGPSAKCGRHFHALVICNNRVKISPALLSSFKSQMGWNRDKALLVCSFSISHHSG